MSQLEVDKIIPQSGTTLTIGETGDTISFASGVLPALESLTITGDLTVDTTTLKVDSTNNRVGIGTASPSYDLQISKDGGGASVRLDVVNTGVAANDDTLLSFLSGSNNNENIIFFGDTDDTNVGIIRYNHASDYMSFTTNASEAMRIDSSGNVGIGTTSPSSKLEVLGQISALRTSTSGQTRVLTLGGARNGANNSFANVDFENYDDSGTSTDFIGARISGIEDGADDAGLSFHTATDTTLSEAMRIDSSGRVGISTTSPQSTLDIGDAGVLSIGTDSGDAFNTNSKIRIQASSTNDAYLQIKTGTVDQCGVLLGDTSDDFVGGMIYFNQTDTLSLYAANASRLDLTSGGVTVNGTLTIDGGAGFVDVTGNYGNFQVNGGGTTGGYDGLNVNGHTVFMSNGSRAGIYNDTNNEWLLYGDFNGDTALHYNGAIKLQTTSTGVSVTGTLSATTLSGAGVYTAGSVANSNNSNGYIRFANNLIIQWVRKTVGGTQTITLPTAMNRYYGAYTGSQTTGNATLRIHSLSTTQVVVGNRDGNITGWVLVYGRKT